LSNSKVLIIAGGSPSSILATALLCRARGITAGDIGDGDVSVVFAQAFEVWGNDRSGRPYAVQTAIESLPEDGFVLWVGLGVNNRDPEMTASAFRAMGARITGVYDEHEPERWETLKTELGLHEGFFFCRGKEQGVLSAASLTASGADTDHIFRLAGDWADNRQLEVSPEAQALAWAIDTATKVRIVDNQFRVTTLLHLLDDPQAARLFQERLEEGMATEMATQAALDSAELCGNVLVIRQPSGVEINQTSAMFSGYRRAPFVAIVGQKAGEGEVVVVGLNTRHADLGSTNLLQVLAEFQASGIPQKATIRGGDVNTIVGVLNSLS